HLTLDISTLSLHDALPIWRDASKNWFFLHSLNQVCQGIIFHIGIVVDKQQEIGGSIFNAQIITACKTKVFSASNHFDIGKLMLQDRKSTRLNSSHVKI